MGYAMKTRYAPQKGVKEMEKAKYFSARAS